jgi:hypothetical protein
MQIATPNGTRALWRAVLAWGVLIAAEGFARLLFDTFAPPAPTGYGPRSALTTCVAAGTFVLLGAVETSRSGRIRSGPIVALLAGLAGHLLGIAGTAVLYFTVIAPDATRLATFDMTGGWDETLGFSVVVPLVGALFALIGAVMSRAFSRVSSLAVARR